VHGNRLQSAAGIDRIGQIMLKAVLTWAAIALGVLVVLAAAFYGWAAWRAATTLGRTFAAHTVDFPVPFPLSPDEVAQLRQERLDALRAAGAALTDDRGLAVDPLAGVDLDAIARERALERGRHLVGARYVCVECHGADFGGGTMIDDPLIGRLLGPNLTGCTGGQTGGYTVADWDRIVRHGIRRDGHPAAMPSEDFELMSDQELADVITYVQSMPAVDREMPPVSLGPLGTVLMATGNIPLSADLIEDHQAAHPERPPAAEPNAEFGAHIANVCSGCHRPTFQGGPIPAGPPDWLPASNLTPHPDGLAGWTYEQFVAAMREGRRPDGTQLGIPMTLMRPYAERMTEVELRALWAYLQSVPPLPDAP
jgi:mono/diheme cytochrome c family protein